MPLLETKGAGSAQGFGLSLGSAERVYIEDVFSTYLYTGNGSTQTITNGIDLAGEGGLVWVKSRSVTGNNWAQDTVRGVNSVLYPNLTNGAGNPAGTAVSAFNANGWTLGTNTNINNPSDTYASWTFRKQPKFFDIVTYTGDGVAGRTIAHNLGSVPGCIIVKGVSDAGQWGTYHRSLGASSSVYLNSTIASFSAGFWDNTTPTATHFSVASTFPNNSGQTYVAYLFAHDAGGFGLTGTDNVISCGSYTGNGSATGPVITLGYEPQWVMIKNASNAQNWYLLDNMRGMPVGSADANLIPNTSNAESDSTVLSPTATGFQLDTAGSPNQSGDTFIYIAIRRGPMKVPTSGTEVFEPVAYTGNGGTQSITSNFPVDLSITDNRTKTSAAATDFKDRLRGKELHLGSQYTYAEQNEGHSFVFFDRSVNVGMGVGSRTNDSGVSYVTRLFRRAPGFFDVVCLNSTTSAAQVLSHNLGVAPELIISKHRNGTAPWQTMDATNYLRLNTDQADIGVPQYHTFTSTTFSINSGACSSGENWVFYLFATLAGVSKYGTYTGTGTTQVINCGFTAGARFVMIKRTDSTGDWYVWDSARGIVAGNDPYLLLNSTAAEVTSTDYVDTASTGFEISSTAPAAINANGGNFIFFAVA